MQTGTIQVRAVFPNKEGQLLPGQFVRIEITGMTLLDALLVPKPAISQGPQGPFVYVVGPGNVVAARPVKLGRELTSGWVITNGLKSGEQIVVDGVMRVRPGAPVRPATAPAAGAAAPAGQAAVPAKASAAPAGGTK